MRFGARERCKWIGSPGLTHGTTAMKSMRLRSLKHAALASRVEIDGDSSRMQGDDVRLGSPGRGAPPSDRSWGLALSTRAVISPLATASTRRRPGFATVRPRHFAKMGIADATGLRSRAKAIRITKISAALGKGPAR